MNGQNAINNTDGGYNDIKFDGILCKATNDKGVVHYFIADPSGKALKSLEPNFIYPCGFSIETPKDSELQYDPNEAKLDNLKAKAKPDTVEVWRYFRKWDTEHNQISSAGGLTCLVRMHYPTKTMRVYPAFCSDDENFCKETGRNVAVNMFTADAGIEFEFDSNLSIYDNLNRAIFTDEYSFTRRKHIWDNDNRNMARLFRKQFDLY